MSSCHDHVMALAEGCKRAMLLPLWEVATREEKKMSAHLWRLVITAPILALGLGPAADAAELNPAALVYELPDEIKWSPTSIAGSQNSNMFGDASKQALYVVHDKCMKANTLDSENIT